MTAKQLQTIYPAIPLEALQRIHNTLTDLTTLQNQINTLQQKIDALMAQPRCTGRISGRHCIHPTGQNCPHPRHHRPDLQLGQRIRASIRKNEIAEIQQAIKNAQILKELQTELQSTQRTIDLKLWSLTNHH